MTCVNPQHEDNKDPDCSSQGTHSLTTLWILLNCENTTALPRWKCFFYEQLEGNTLITQPPKVSSWPLVKLLKKKINNESIYHLNEGYEKAANGSWIFCTVNEEAAGNARDILCVAVNVYFTLQQPEARYIGNLSMTLIGEKWMLQL